jgi:hypothetical protein
VQPRLEQIGKQAVVAEPFTFIIQRDDEQVLAAQRIQHLLPSLPFGDRLAQAGVQALMEVTSRKTALLGLLVKTFDQVFAAKIWLR